MSFVVLPRPAPPAKTSLRKRNIGELGRELGITHVQVDRWNAFAAALEELELRRDELDNRERDCAMDAPADVEEVINLRVNWVQQQLEALNRLRLRTASLCEVLTSRQRQKANRLLQSLSKRA